LELLEVRDLMSVASLSLSGSTLVVKSNNQPTSVEVHLSGASYVVQEVGSSRSWTYAASRVSLVEFRGGAGDDRFVDFVGDLPVRAYGNGGDDYLEGYDGADTFYGGPGDDTLVGYGGNDKLFGNAGHDVLLGMNGNDQLVGHDGNDRLNGGAGGDKLYGGGGNDVLIAIDNATGDSTQGDGGADAVWVDRNAAALDRVFGASTADTVQHVSRFANGADRTLDGDRLADPVVKSGQSYRQFANRPLFSSAGPLPTDVNQGALGDCYLLAGLAAIADDSPYTVRGNVVDFDDGTYGVRLGDDFYRVDNDLPVTGNSNSPAYASLGREGSMWVAVVEKAFAHYRTAYNSYEAIEGGWSVEINYAWGAAAPGDRDLHSFSSATALANEIYLRWSQREAVTIGFLSARAGGGGAPLITGHMYTVMSVLRNAAGAVVSITLRNPWGIDGAGNDSNPNDGLVTVTPQQIYGYNGRLNWGRV
jgi:hypothetical protein